MFSPKIGVVGSGVSDAVNGCLDTGIVAAALGDNDHVLVAAGGVEMVGAGHCRGTAVSGKIYGQGDGPTVR